MAATAYAECAWVLCETSSAVGYVPSWTQYGAWSAEAECLLTVKALGGWNRLEMVERYSHLAPAHKRAAIERLANTDPLRQAAADSASGTYTGTGPSDAKPSRESIAV